MKRDFFHLKITRNALLWICGFLIATLVLMLLLFVLTLLQIKLRMSDGVLQIILMILLSFAAGLCAYLFCLFAKVKGIFSGLVTAIIYSLIKLVLSLCSGGVGAKNFLIYVCLASVSLIGGIAAANRRDRPKRIWSK